MGGGGICLARLNTRSICFRAQNSGMLSRDQLLFLFDRFSSLTSLPEVKKRIADAVNDKQEPVAVTTANQEEIFTEMGVDPQFGLGRVSLSFEDDQDLMIQFYGFVAKEEIACEEAELGPEGFAKRIEMLRRLEVEQLDMLKHMRKFQLDDQSAILEKMENAGFQPEGVYSYQSSRSRTLSYPCISANVVVV